MIGKILFLGTGGSAGKRPIQRLACPGIEKFFVDAPFSIQRALALDKIRVNQPFYRGVFDPTSNKLKLLECHNASGAIDSAILYLPDMAEEERVNLERQLKEARLPFTTNAICASSIRETSYNPNGNIIERVEYVSPGRVGETEIKSGDWSIRKKTIFGHQGEPLLEETYKKDGTLIAVDDIRPPFTRQLYFAPYEGINCALRLGFDSFEELQTIARVGQGRVELALPYQMGFFNRTLRGRAQEAIELLRRNPNLKIATLHAVQAPISHEDFLLWGETVLQIADSLGAETVTFHPNKLKPDIPKEEAQKRALAIIQELQSRHRAVIAVETFTGRSRLFRAEDLVKYGIPIVLDVAHESNEGSVNLIKYHSGLIRTIHLSAKGEKVHHLPADRFCLDVLEQAMMAGWRGNVVLEYLPNYFELMPVDLQRLENFLK